MKDDPSEASDTQTVSILDAAGVHICKLHHFLVFLDIRNNATTLFVNFSAIASIYNMLSAKKKIFDNFFLMKNNNKKLINKS